jgi:thiol-disulfide isomerase/thioredoxin
MFFTSTTCSPCEALVPTIEKWQAEFGEKVTIALASTGTIGANKGKFGKNKNGAIVLNQKDQEISALFRAQWTPSAVFINRDGTIASNLAVGDSEIQKLLDRIKANLQSAPNGNGNKIHHNFYFLPPDKLTNGAPHAGQPVPEFELRTLDNNKKVSLADLQGKRTFLLIWRATCPHCQKILTDFKKWEAEQHDFNVLVVAADEPEVLLAKEFKSTVVLERDFEFNKIIRLQQL